MIRLAFQQLHKRGARYASLFFAIFASVALTVGATALTGTVITSVNDLFNKPYTDTDIVATASAQNHATIENMHARIAAHPDVEAVAFDQAFSVSMRQPDGIYASTVVQSVEPGPLQWRSITEGRLPENAGEIAVTATADAPSVGSTVSLRVPSQTEDVVVTVAGHVEASSQETLNGSIMVLALPDALAEWNESSTRGEFRITVQASTPNSATNLTAVISETITEASGAIAKVSTAAAHVDELTDSYLGKRDRYFLLLSAFVLVAAAVAFLVVFSSYSVLTGERSREFGLIRAVGASTPQILGSVVIESAILGIVAAGLGAPSGLLAARLLANESSRFGVRVPLESITVPSSALWLIAGAGVAVSVLAALPAALSACRHSTVDALSTPAVSRNNRWFALLWLVLALGLGTGAWWSLERTSLLSSDTAVLFAIAAAGAIVLALLILTALILPSLIHLISRVLGRTPLPTLQLGLAFAGKQKIRSAALVAVILAGSALSSAVLHGQAQVRDYLVAAASGMGGTDLSITALDADVPVEMLSQIQELPGVAAATAPAATSVTFPGAGSTTALLLSEHDGAQVMRSGDTGASPGAIMLGRSSGLQENFAPDSETQVEINDVFVTVQILHGDDYATFIDPGVVTRARDLKAGELGVSAENLPAPPVRNILVLSDGPANQFADNPTAQSVREVIAGFSGRYSVSEGFTARTNTLRMVDRVTTMSTLLAIVALAIAAIGLINTVSLTVAERARDRKLLRSLGLTASGQTSVMCIEMVALALPSSLVGAVAGGQLGRYVAGVATGNGKGLGMDMGGLDIGVIAGTTGAMVLGAVLCGVVVLKRKFLTR